MYDTLTMNLNYSFYRNQQNLSYGKNNYKKIFENFL